MHPPSKPESCNQCISPWVDQLILSFFVKQKTGRSWSCFPPRPLRAGATSVHQPRGPCGEAVRPKSARHGAGLVMPRVHVFLATRTIHQSPNPCIFLEIFWGSLISHGRCSFIFEVTKAMFTSMRAAASCIQREASPSSHRSPKQALREQFFESIRFNLLTE